MVTSFKSTFVEWLENRIFADYYINIANEIKLNEIQAIVKKYNGEVYPIIKNEGSFNDKPVEIYGFKPTGIYEKNWPLLRNTKMLGRKLGMARPSLLANNYLLEKKIDLNDFLELEINNKKINVRVGGITQISNPHNQLMMQLKLYRIFSSQTPSTLAVKLDGNKRLPFSMSCHQTLK